MQPLTSEQIKGTWATLMLPINSDDSIDFGRLKQDTDYLVTTGADGLYTHGTAGEFYAITEDEFDLANVLLAEKCERAQLPFQIGASHMSAQTALDRIRRAAQLKPGAIQVILPDWFPVTIPEARAFLERAAEAADPIGLVLYNPPHAKRVLQPTEYAELAAAIPALVGLKVLGDAKWYAELHRLAPQLSMFVGGHHLATGVGVGGAGAYSNVACLHPVAAKRWNDLMATDYKAALALEARILSFLEEFIVPFRKIGGHSNQALDKLMAMVGGWSAVGTRLRWPYRGVDESEVPRVRGALRERLPEFAL